jgi:predicted dehydrogenase
MSRARIGVIGAGFWAAYFYLPFLRDHPDAVCVGVVRRNRDALAALERAFDLELATTEVDELLAAGCDGIIVASPHALHREHAEQALRAGAHVLIEKPMTVELAEARAVAETARETDRVLSLAHGWNYSRMAAWAMDFAASGRLGRLTSITGLMASSLVELFSGRSGYGKLELGGYEFEASAETWAKPDAGGGYLYGQLSHQLGVALALVRSEPREVFARMQRNEVGVDLDVSVSVAFEDGVIGSFSGHGRLPWGTRYPLELRLAGENGVLTLDFERERADANLVDGAAEGSWEIGERHHAFTSTRADLGLELEPGEGLYTCDGPAQFLIDVCLGRETLDRAPAKLGVRAVAVMDAARRSAELGKPVAVAEL